MKKKNIEVLAVFLDIALTLENSSVFQSQLGEQLLALRSLGYQVSVLTVFKDLGKFDEVIGDKFKKAGIEVMLVKHKNIFANLINMAKTLRKSQKRIIYKMAYIRGIWGALVLKIANPIISLPYIYDVRGALIDETKAVGHAKLKLWIYEQLENWAIRKANSVTAVSTVLSKFIKKKYNITTKAVIPCCLHVSSFHVSAKKRKERRDELGFDDKDIVLVYSGGLSHYQQIPAMLNLWIALLDVPYVKYLMLTNSDPQKNSVVDADLLNSLGKRLKMQSLPASQVFRTLASADIGFMLRDSRELNQVASPVKFAEYAAAGLAIVASPKIGDISDSIIQEDLGVLINPDNIIKDHQKVRKLISHYQNNRDLYRASSQEIAKKCYDWHAHRDSFIKLYGSPN